jgi:hypothetical protein
MTADIVDHRIVVEQSVIDVEQEDGVGLPWPSCLRG